MSALDTKRIEELEFEILSKIKDHFGSIIPKGMTLYCNSKNSPIRLAVDGGRDVFCLSRDTELKLLFDTKLSVDFIEEVMYIAKEVVMSKKFLSKHDIKIKGLKDKI